MIKTRTWPVNNSARLKIFASLAEDMGAELISVVSLGISLQAYFRIPSEEGWEKIVREGGLRGIS